MANYNFQQIAANWIVKNNPNGVRQVLVNNGLISTIDIANALDYRQLITLLYNYYLKNGASSYGNLLSQIPVNENLSENDMQIVEAALSDLKALNGQSQVGAPQGAFTTQDFKSSVQTFWDLLVGKSVSETAPVITTTTKSSPLTVGLIIGGIAIVAIIAWVIIKI